MHHHVQDMIVLLEEGNHTLPRCPKWNMFVYWMELIGMHQATLICAKGSEHKIKRMREEEA